MIPARWLPPLLLALIIGGDAILARAAGFDCRKAGTPLEKTICQDPVASALDEQLAAAYRDAGQRCPDAVLRTEQQRWLHEVRNVCRDVACLAPAYRSRIAELHTRQCRAAGCAGVEQRLIGAWRQASAVGSFEEIAFAAGNNPRQGRFDTWLHRRPEFVNGRWQLEACELRLLLPGEPDASAMRMTLRSVDADHLVVLEPDQTRPARYRRVRP
jgi:uncharacterized protein